MNKKGIFITIIISGIAFGVNYLINLVLGSFISIHIGTEAYGFVSLSSTFATYALIVTSALNSYATRYIAIEYHKSNLRKANIYYNSVFWGDILIGGIILGIGLLIAAFSEQLFNTPNYLASDVRTLFIFVFINVFINVAGTALQSASIIKDKIMISSVFKGLSYVCEAVFLIAMYHYSAGKVFYVGISFTIASMVVLLANIFLTRKYTPELIINIHYFNVKYVNELVINGIWNSINSLGNSLNSGLDLLMTNYFLGTFAMGQVSLVKTLVNVFSGLFQMVAQPFQPSFIKDFAKSDKHALIAHLKFSMKVSGLISNLAFAIVVAFGVSYYKLWVPNQDIEYLYRLTIIATATSILEGPIYPLYYIYTLTVKNKVPCIITVMGGILNVSGMILLIRYTQLGGYAVFLTTAIIMLSINGITNPLYMCKCLKIKWNSFYDVLGKHILSCMIITVTFMFLRSNLFINSWMEFIAASVVCCFIGAIIHFCIMFEYDEKISIIQHVIEFFKHKQSGIK